MLHFAYGSNMHRAVMRKHAPCAQALGAALLADHRFLITSDGYASVERARGKSVHGVLWHLTPRDRATLDAWENIAAGLYRAEIRPVRFAGGLRQALTYMARRRPPGRPKAGYLEVVLAAAEAWDFPRDYVATLQRWLPARAALGGDARKLMQFEIEFAREGKEAR